MLSALEKQKLGEKTAISLMKEMQFLKPVPHRADLDDLLEIPNRENLDFQIIKGLPAAKAVEHICSDLVGLRYCVTDGVVENLRIFDIDHTVPFAHIRKKQTALLDWLNDQKNHDFKSGFLNAQTEDGESIDKYFGTCDNVVKGKRRFFKLCYNDIDNLLLLCHACNLAKGNKDSLTWFKEQTFLGDVFVDAVKENGGLHEGIILKKIGKFASNEAVQIGELECKLHDGNGKGLGQFVTEWFEERNPNYAEKIVNAYADIWLELKKIYEERLKVEAEEDEKRIVSAEEKQKLSDKLTNMLKTAIQTVKEHYKSNKEGAEENTTGDQEQHVQGSSPRSESSGDDTIEQDFRAKELYQQILGAIQYMHGVKKIQRLIVKHDDSLNNKEAKLELYDYLKNQEISTENVGVQTKIFDKVYKDLESKYQSSHRPSVDDIKNIIAEAVAEFSIKHQLAAAMAARAEEMAARLVAEKEATELRAEKLKAERKVAELQFQIHVTLEAKIVYSSAKSLFIEWMLEKSADNTEIQGYIRSFKNNDVIPAELTEELTEFLNNLKTGSDSQKNIIESIFEVLTNASEAYNTTDFNDLEKATTLLELAKSKFDEVKTLIVEQEQKINQESFHALEPSSMAPAFNNFQASQEATTIISGNKRKAEHNRGISPNQTKRPHT